MLKLIMCVKRRSDLTREQFDTHWFEVHGPLVRKHAETLGIRKYIQTVPLNNRTAQIGIQTGRGTQAVDFDGCAELWWDDLEAHQAARKTEAGNFALRDLIEDERRFVDLSHSQLWYGVERVIVPQALRHKDSVYAGQNPLAPVA